MNYASDKFAKKKVDAMRFDTRIVSADAVRNIPEYHKRHASKHQRRAMDALAARDSRLAHHTSVFPEHKKPKGVEHGLEAAIVSPKSAVDKMLAENPNDGWLTGFRHPYFDHPDHLLSVDAARLAKYSRVRK